MSFLIEKYDYMMNEAADPRVKKWLFFDTPWLTLTIVAIYILMVYSLLPAFMKNRPAYNLKKFVLCYNICQIVCCCVLIYALVNAGWGTTYSLGCQPVDYSNSQEALSMLTCCYYTHLLKGVELIETFVFILRKKSNQVSNLHVYHHASTFFLTWILVKYVGGGMATFPVLINSFIHVLMYSYYLLAGLGEKWQKKLEKWKPRLTMLQMIQFALLLAHATFAVHPECKVSKQFLWLYVPNVILIFQMFWQFYRQSYLRQKAKQ